MNEKHAPGLRRILVPVELSPEAEEAILRALCLDDEENESRRVGICREYLANGTAYKLRRMVANADNDYDEASDRIADAAPDLLAALQAMLRAVAAGVDADPEVWRRAHALADAALAKAVPR